MEEAPLSSSSYDDDAFVGDDVWSLSLQEDIFSGPDVWAGNDWESPSRQTVPYTHPTRPPVSSQRNNFTTTSAAAGPSQHQYFHHTHPPPIRSPVHPLGLPRFPPSVPHPSVNNPQNNQHDRPPSSLTSKDSDASHLSWNVLSSGDESDRLSEKSDAGDKAPQNSSTGHHIQSRSLPQDGGEFVDLTGETPPRLGMAPASEERASKRRRLSGNESSQTPQPRKKNRSNNSSQNDTIPAVEEVDLRDVDDDKGLSKVLEDQRMATIKAQQEQAAIPVKLATLSCIICMDAMKDVTATSCGHLFCHSCLMEALIAGENQGSEPGRGSSKCPVCRKKVKRPTGNKKDAGQVVSLEIKIKGRDRAKPDKGKGRDEATTHPAGEHRSKQQLKKKSSVPNSKG